MTYLKYATFGGFVTIIMLWYPLTQSVIAFGGKR